MYIERIVYGSKGDNLFRCNRNRLLGCPRFSLREIFPIQHFFCHGISRNLLRKTRDAADKNLAARVSLNAPALRHDQKLWAVISETDPVCGKGFPSAARDLLQPINADSIRGVR